MTFQEIHRQFTETARVDPMESGEHFLHVSVSRRSRLPSWDDLKLVKKSFIGEDREAVHVLPKASDYINLHPYCLHLWGEI